MSLLAYRISFQAPGSTALILVAALPCVAGSQFIFGALRASGRVVLAAIGESLVQPALAATGAFYVSSHSPSGTNFALAFSISWTVTLWFAFHVNWRGEPLTRPVLVEFLRTGRSMLGVSAVNQVAGAADLLLLGVFATSTEVGRYAVANKIATAFVLLHGAITTAATPFMRGFNHEHDLLARYYHTVTRYMLALSIPLVVLTIAAPRLLLSLFGSDYGNSSSFPLLLLSVAAIALLVSGPAGSILLCTGNSRQMLRATTAGATAVIVSVALFAKFGAIGAAIGVLTGRLIARALLVVTMRRYAKIEVEDVPVVLILGGAFIGVIATRIAIPLVGDLPAVIGGSAIALALATVVLVRSGDLGILREEFRFK